MARREKSSFHVRLDKEFHAEISQRAAKNNRSIHAEYVALLKHGIQAQSLEMVVAQAISRCVPRPDAFGEVVKRASRLMDRDMARTIRDGSSETSHEYQMLQHALEDLVPART
jgi:plasmid stability protein